MHKAGIDSMILYLSSSEAEQQWCLHVAEIIALLLREQVGWNTIICLSVMYFIVYLVQSPEELASFNINERDSRHDDELKNIRNQEEKQKKRHFRSGSSRYSHVDHFGFIMK